MDVDLEIGGRDQIFNMLAGRTLMKRMRRKEKFVLATKLLVDPSGKKMGKTEGDTINLDEVPEVMYGKIMSWPDSLISVGFELCTSLPADEIVKILNQIKEGRLSPWEAKARLAREIVSVCHDKKAATEAEKDAVEAQAKGKALASAIITKTAGQAEKRPANDFLGDDEMIATPSHSDYDELAALAKELFP